MPFVWVPINPIHKSIASEYSLAIDFVATTAELDRFAKELGSAFAENLTDMDRPILHQSVVTMQIFKEASQRSVEVCS
jgi:hypothetical protein